MFVCLNKSICFLFLWQHLSPAISNQCRQTPVQWITLTNKTVCDFRHVPRQNRPPWLLAEGGPAAWDSSATTLLLLFLLSLSSSAPRNHSHSSLPDPAATMQNPWDSPDDTLFPLGHQSLHKTAVPMRWRYRFLTTLIVSTIKVMPPKCTALTG